MKTHDVKSSGQAILDNLLSVAIIPSEAIIGSYWPVKSEVDVRPLLAYFYDHSHICALPVVQASKKPLLFRQWRPGNLLVSGLYNILTPDDTAPPGNAHGFVCASSWVRPRGPSPWLWGRIL